MKVDHRRGLLSMSASARRLAESGERAFFRD